MDLEKISKLIKLKRKEINLTQEELAKKINVTEKAISRWETGRGTPDISLLIPLSDALNLDVSELLNGDEKKKNIDNSITTIIEYEEKSKKIKNKVPIIISIILYIIFIFLYLLYLKATYSINHITYLGHIIFNLIFVLIIFLANWNLYTNYFDKKIEKKKIYKITYGIILALYIIMILNVTIYERQLSFGFKWQGLDNYFKYGGLNIIPFRTIIKYITDFERYWPRHFIINILGNIVIFMPVQFLMMKIFGQLSFKKYLAIDIILILIIEILQFLTGSGAFDVDDIILNILGVFIIYFCYIKYTNLKKL